MEISIHKITANSQVDGPGKRTVLFVQGCPIGCDGCQNKHIWPKSKGKIEDTESVAKTLIELASKTKNITISGGEPFFQAVELAALVKAIRMNSVGYNIIVYTGFTWEKLISGMITSYFAVMDVLTNIDILIDGPFIKALDDSMITYRGSRNQRIIDVKQSLAKKEVITLAWDMPEIQITVQGEAFMPIGLAPAFADLGNVEPTRMCGQTK